MPKFVPCCVQVPAADNYYAALNSAVFSDGSFCYIPKGVRCPMEVATYFRINAETSGQVCFGQHYLYPACWFSSMPLPTEAFADRGVALRTTATLMPCTGCVVKRCVEMEDVAQCASLPFAEPLHMSKSAVAVADYRSMFAPSERTLFLLGR